MNAWLTSLLVVWVLVGSASSVEQHRTWSLPSDPQAIVLELRFEEPGRSGGVALRVRRDGSFVVPSPAGRPTLTGRLSERALTELVGELLEDHRCLELESDALAAAIEREGRRTGKDWRVQGAAISVVRIALSDRTHELRCAAPELLQSRFPELRELRRVCAIQRRLRNVVAIARVGGEPEAARLAALVAAELRRERDVSAPVTPRDLVEVNDSTGDLRQYQFVVEAAPTGTDPATSLHISVFEAPGEPVRISVTSLPQ